jgi:Kef-type K+ transport system membrane component KefB
LQLDYQLPIQDVVLQFTVVIAAALAVQLPLERSRVPGIVGLIILGMVIGPGGLGILPEEPVVDLFGSIGLLFIMFIAGLEMDIDVVRQHRREAALFGLLAFALSLLPGVAIGLLSGLAWSGALLLGGAISSHTLLSYPVIEKLGLVHHRPIVTAIGGTLLTDTLALVLLVVVTQLAGAGGEAAWAPWYLPLILLVGLVAVALVIVPRFGGWLLENAQANRAERALLLLAILLLLAVAADAIGTEDILGAFLAGVCLNRIVQRRKELREHLEFAGRMLFIPFFFVATGMWLKLEVLFGSLALWGNAFLLLMAILFAKTATSWIIGSMSGYSRTARVTMIGLTIPQAAATLAIVVTGRENGLFGQEVVDAIIVVIFVTCLVGPLLTGFFGQRLAESRHAEPRSGSTKRGDEDRPSLTRIE